MSNMQRKHLDLSIKSVDDRGVIVGYGSVYNNVDGHGDIVLPGAFKKTLTERKPKLLWQHDPSQPIGVITSAKEDGRGLHITAKLAVNTAKGAEAHELISMGAVDGLSIGYQTVKDKFHKSGLRHIEECKLYEVSVVTFPSNESSIIESIKSAHDDVRHDEAAKIAEIVNMLLALQNKGLNTAGTDVEEPPEQDAMPADEALDPNVAANGEEPQTSIEPQLQELLHSLGSLQSQIESTINGTNHSRGEGSR